MISSESLVYAFTESGDVGFIVGNRQLLVDCFKDHQPVPAATLPLLPNGHAFLVSIKGLLDLNADAIRIVEDPRSLEAFRISSAPYDRKIGLGFMRNGDIGIVFPSFKSFINCLGQSFFFYHLLAEDFQNLDITDNSSECLLLNLANLVHPTFCPLRKVKTTDLLYFPASFATVLSAATASCPTSVKDGTHLLSIFRSATLSSKPSESKGKINPKHIRFSSIQSTSVPAQQEAVKPNPGAHQPTLLMQSMSRPPLGRSRIRRPMLAASAPVTELPNKVSNAKQMHQLQLSGPRGRAVHTPSDYSEAYTTPESSFDFTPSHDSEVELMTTQQTQRRKSPTTSAHGVEVADKAGKLAPKVVARSSPSKAMTPAGAIVTFTSLKSPPTVVQRGHSATTSPTGTSPVVPFHPNPSSVYEDENILNLLFSNPFEMRFREVFKFLKSYGWKHRDVPSLWKHGPVFLRPHCSGANIDFRTLKKDEDFFINESDANKWLLRDFHTNAEGNVQAFRIRYNLLPAPEIEEFAGEKNLASKTKKAPFVQATPKEENYFKETESSPENANTGAAGAQGSPDSFTPPDGELEDWEIIKLLFRNSDGKKSAFQSVFKYLRSYNWTYEFGALANFYYRPHCQAHKAANGKINRHKLMEGVDYFCGDTAAESWLKKEIQSKHHDLFKAAVYGTDPQPPLKHVNSDSKSKKVEKPKGSSTNRQSSSSKMKTPASGAVGITDNNEEYFVETSQPQFSDMESSPEFSSSSQPTDEFSDPIIIETLFGQSAASKQSFQKTFKFLRSYNWYYDYGSGILCTYYRPHCLGKDLRTLQKNEDYFCGEDAAESWLKQEITKLNPALVEAAQRGELGNSGTPFVKLPAVRREAKAQKKGSGRLRSPKTHVRKLAMRTPDESKASPLCDLSDDFREEDSPSDNSVISELQAKARRSVKRGNWSDEPGDSDESATVEPKRKKRLMSDSRVAVPLTLSGPICQRIEINIDPKIYTHLPVYEGNVDLFMSQMVNCIDDDAFHNQHLPFPVPGRKQESIDIFLNIMQSIRAGTGKLLFIAGFPGGGKTQSLIVIVKFIESLLKQYSQPTYLDALVQNKKKSNDTTLGYSSVSDTDTSVKQRHYCDKYMHFVRVNCVSLVDVDHLYELVNSEMCILSKKVNNKREIREVMDSVLLNTPALPCTLPITSIEADAGCQLHSPNIVSTRGKWEFLPMLVLVLDEFDYIKTNKPAIYDCIMKWTQGRVLVLGSGNMMHAVMSAYVQSTTTLVFKAYDVPDLCSILQYRTGSLFNKAAQQMLALKVKERNNGDVRRLLGWAKASMQLAWTMHKGGSAAAPVSLDGFISIPHIAKTEPQSFETEQRKSLSVLTPQLRTLLVSFIVSNGTRLGFTYKQAYSNYNEYVAKYNLGHESMDAVKAGISNLLDYAMITRLNPSAKADQAIFRVNLREEELLNLDTNSLPEVQKNDIRRFIHQQKHLAEEENGGF